MVYHGRNGAMRQGRTSFPAMVLQQHPDDGSLDLIVDYEAEDRIWEQRVRQRSSPDEGHCWSFVEPVEALGPLPEEELATIDAIREHVDALNAAVIELHSIVRNLSTQMYGEYHPPEKSMIEYLDDFDKRLKKIEAKL